MLKFTDLAQRHLNTSSLPIQKLYSFSSSNFEHIHWRIQMHLKYLSMAQLFQVSKEKTVRIFSKQFESNRMFYLIAKSIYWRLRIRNATITVIWLGAVQCRLKSTSYGTIFRLDNFEFVILANYYDKR